MKTFVSTKKYICSAILASAVSLAGPVMAQGESCVGIDNDIARLQCFDEAFKNSSPNDKLSPAKAIENLVELVAYSGSDVVFSIGSGPSPCMLSATMKYARYHALFDNQYIITAKTDLSKVERIGGTAVLGRMRAFVLFTERGFEGNWTQQHFSRRGPETDARLVNNAQMKVNNSYSGRDAKFPFLVPEYFSDEAKVREALGAAVSACQS